MENQLKDKMDFKLNFLVDQSPKEVYNAILNVRSWWSGLFGEEISGSANELNDEFTFHAGGGAHYSKQKLIELIPEQKVTWLVIDSNLSFVEKTHEWNNTKIGFEINKLEDKTQVSFIHQGLVPEMECYDSCSNAWSQYLERFLQPLKNKFKGQALNN